LRPHSYTTLKTIYPSFATRRMVGGGGPFYLKFWDKLTHRFSVDIPS